MIPPTSAIRTSSPVTSPPVAPAPPTQSPPPPVVKPSGRRVPPRPDRNGLIIERPDLQPRRERIVYGTITAVAWALWMYLWLPLVTLVAWYFGARAFIREVVIPDRVTLLATGATYLLVILILGGALLVWSRYNLRRFGGEDRRTASAPLGREEIQAWFAIPATTLDFMRSEGSVVVQHGEAGEVEGVRAPDPEAWPVRNTEGSRRG
ncbi:MAG: poly-beta-1,6-N-acetyl-D-glucosamine biosynthesis protein PgaD [Gemmatimonadales bacterium]|nr:MAG: poly-beta-1,6-N-acetyl-D-glucosamine biosynthesis protein PgaD [Gemmatimonadales bacterium]